MRVPLDWLEELVELPCDPSDLAERLTRAGLEVESVEREAVAEQVVVGEVLDVRDHPRGGHLRSCRVAIGGGDPLAIVCGAPNLAPHQRVAVALPGARLPAGPVESRDVQGVRSAGVLCSERDLGIGEDHAGILVLSSDDLRNAGGGKDAVQVPTPGTALDCLLPAVSVLDIAITPNRGDCCSILGIAREVSALWGAKMRPRRHASPVADDEEQSFAVTTEAHDLCPWYCAQRFHAPACERAPLWMRRRLALAGVRAISAAVDVTNYVMLERGQPLHAFDLDLVRGARLVVRRARPAERLRLLDGRELDLAPDDLVIADGREAVALAGVMGGAATEVGPETKRIALESAVFSAPAVRRTARRLGIQTEASFRFERGVDPTGAAAAIARAAVLFASLGGRPIGRLLESGGPTGAAAPIAFVPKRVNALLGTSIEPSEMVRRLRAGGATVRRTHGETIEVIPAVYRADLRHTADLAEEIARIGGYDAIPIARPRILARTRPGAASGLRWLLGSLAAQGFTEAVPLAFNNPKENERFPGLWRDEVCPAALRNPLATVASEMRRSLLPGLLAALRVNQSRGEAFVPLFAAGTVFARAADGQYLEHTDMAALVWGAPPAPVGRAPHPLGFLDVKRIAERLFDAARIVPHRWEPLSDVPFLHPGQAAEVLIGRDRVGRVGCLHPGLGAELDLREGHVWVMELDADLLRAHRRETPRYVEPPRFPAVERDIALVVDEEVRAAAIVDALLDQGHALVEKVVLFDEYRGAGVPEGRKSLAYTISYRAQDRTLTDVEVNAAHEDLIRRLATTVRYERRGSSSGVGT